MAYFDSQNGWIQFVFANEQDTYYLPSLMRVGFYRYLLFCLKRAGYEAVYFWNEYEGKQELSYMDEVSAEYYEKIRPKGFLEKLFGGQAYSDFQDNEWTTVPAGPDLMEKLFYEIAGSKKKKAALVVPVKVFDSFFSMNMRKEKLLEQKGKYGSGGNLILLTASAKAEDSNHCFTRKDGILPGLFEEVGKAALPDGISHLYEKLQVNMNECCIYLNELHREMLTSLVKKNSLLSDRNMIPPNGELMGKVAAVIEWYYHSQAFRRETPVVLPENRKREFQVIDKSLQNQRTCDVILFWIEQAGPHMKVQEFRSFLRSRYPKDGCRCYIYSDDFLLRQWDQLSLPDEIRGAKREVLNTGMQQCRRLLQAVVFRGDGSTEKDKLDACMDQIKISLADRDITSLEYGLKAMEYLLETFYKQPQYREDIWNFYKKIFELSKENQRLEKEHEAYRDKIRAARAEMNEVFRQIDRMGEVSQAESGEMDILRQKAVQSDEEIELLKNLSTLNQNQRFQYRQAIASMDQAIFSAAGGKEIDAHVILEQAMSLQQKILQHSMDTMKDVSRVTEKNPELLGKITGQSLTESEDLEERYRALEQKMRKL